MWLHGLDLTQVSTSQMRPSRFCATFVVSVGFDHETFYENIARDGFRSQMVTRMECLHWAGVCIDMRSIPFFSRNAWRLLLPSHAPSLDLHRFLSRPPRHAHPPLVPSPLFPFHRGRTQYGSSMHLRRWDVSLRFTTLHNASQRRRTCSIASRAFVALLFAAKNEAIASE